MKAGDKLSRKVAVLITNESIYALFELTQGLSGKVYGDHGYISKALSNQLLEQGVERITTTSNG